jgi:hypothetical protein
MELATVDGLGRPGPWKSFVFADPGRWRFLAWLGGGFWPTFFALLGLVLWGGPALLEKVLLRRRGRAA